MISRRTTLKTGSGLALLSVLGGAGVLILPENADAGWNKAAFEGKTMAEALKALGAEGAASSGEIQILASDIAENGAVVPVQVISKLAKTEQISILVEKNPSPLASSFDVSQEMLPEVTSRLKMAQTSNVVALVKADGKFFTAAKEIKVTLGGCGG